MQAVPEAYDIIVIGSGAGGLTAAVALAQAGKKVLVCEQHEVPGGYTHSFTLQGYKFSPGVHYIGKLGPGGSLRRIYEGLGVSKDVEFCEMNPTGYDHIVIDGRRYDLPAGRQAMVDGLAADFPHEAEGIAAYVRTVGRLQDAFRALRRAKGLGGVLRALPAGLTIMRWATKTGQDLLDAHVQDPTLAAVLAGHCGDHGLPPDEAPALLQAGLLDHYLDGAFYPRGGGFAIPRAFVRALKRAGGEIRLSTPVEKIIIEDGRAVGVRLVGGEEVRAATVVSNADAEVTLGRLVGRQHLPRRLRRRLDRTQYSASSLSLFFAVDMDLRTAGIDSGNFWFYDDEDLNAIYREGRTDHAMHDDPRAIVLSVSTLKDPSKMVKGHHTCEAFTFVSYDAFKDWTGRRTGDRGTSYEQVKAELAERMFRALETHIPGLRDHVVFWDLATPLTNEHYVNATRGALYGPAKTRDQMGPGAFPVKTAVPGLYMVGASTFSFGVAGATMTGLAAAAKILDRPVRDLLRQDGPPLRVYPAEEPEAWPEELQAKMVRRVPVAAR